MFKAVYLTESKGLKSTLPSLTIVMLNETYDNDHLFFNIFICDLFFDMEIANYVDETTSYTYEFEIEKLSKFFKKKYKLFDWFSNNF